MEPRVPEVKIPVLGAWGKGLIGDIDMEDRPYE